MSSYSNLDLEKMGEALQPLLSLTGMVGYTAARNMRLIADAIGPYVQAKESLLRKYGNAAEGGTYSIDSGDARFGEFWDEFSEIAEVRHEVAFHSLPADRLAEDLTGQQMLDCWFMIEEETDD